MELEKEELNLSQMELRQDQRYLDAMIDLKKEHYHTIEKLTSVFVNAFCSYVNAYARTWNTKLANVCVKMVTLLIPLSRVRVRVMITM